MSSFLSFYRVCKTQLWTPIKTIIAWNDIYKPLIIYCTGINRSNISTLLSTTAGLKLPKRLELAYINTARCNRRGAINKEPCINMPSIKTHPSWDTCLLPARGYSSHAKLGPQEVSKVFKALVRGKDPDSEAHGDSPVRQRDVSKMTCASLAGCASVIGFLLV